MSKHKYFLVKFFLSFIFVFSLNAQNFLQDFSQEKIFFSNFTSQMLNHTSTNSAIVQHDEYFQKSAKSAESENKFLNSLFIKDKSSPFYLDITMDTLLLSSGLSLSASLILLDDIFEINQVDYNSETFSRNRVNSFDRIFMHPYSKTMDLVGTVSCGASLLLPLVNLATPNSQWFKIGTMYAETLLFAFVIKDLIKICENRARPYMYFDGYPQDEVDGGDWNNSFPSGHTTMAFAGASFSAFVFSQYFDGLPRLAVICGSSVLAAGTALCRIMSGNHFLSDVIVGAIIGSASGILIPLLHRNIDFNKDLGNAQLSFNLTNFNVRWEL